jgi:hypothetical protein
MTRTTNARIAGFAFLFYIAAGIAAMVLFGRATTGHEIAAQLAGIARHASDVRLAVVCTMGCSFSALVLGATLYAITRDEDPDLAMLGLLCRAGEGIVAGISVQGRLRLLGLATGAGANRPDTEAARALAAYFLAGQGPAAMFFAVGSALFCWLLLRGRMIPAALAWLGVLASVLMVVALPLQLVGVLDVSINWFLWIPMAAFEIPFALWLLVKGVAAKAIAVPEAQ